MKSTISSFLVMVLISLTTIFSSSFIYAHLQAVAARTFNTNAIDRIQSSNFNQNIIDDVVQAGRDHGYTVTIEDTSIYENQPEYLVKTKYNVGISIPSFGDAVVIGYPAEVEGYAR